MAKKKTAKKAKAVADFKKKKRKAGKLQKSEDTKLSIKTRKISLPTQHNEKTESILYKGKALLELIAGTRHTNSNIRVTNISNLRELLHSSMPQINCNLGQLMSRCGSLLSDPEANVRASNIVLIQLVLQNSTDGDLEPFVKVFIAQLSSSMLHIDKGIQRSTVQVLSILLSTHPKLVYTSSPTLLPSLTTLLSSLKNKITIMSYLRPVSSLLGYILKHLIKEDNRCQIRSVRAAPCVSVIRCRRLISSSTPSTDLSPVEQLVAVSLNQVERLWLEDVPPQVFLSVEPATLHNAIILVELLRHFTRLLYVIKDSTVKVKLYEMCKCVAGRFPLECASKSRNSAILWKLNVTISKYLLSNDQIEAVEQHFINLLNTNTMSSAEVDDCLDVLRCIQSPSTSLLDALVSASLQHNDNSVVFCTYVIQNYLDKISEENICKILQSLDTCLDKVALHLVHYFHGNRKHVVSSILVKCLDSPIFTTLKTKQQMELLELCYDGMPTQSLSLLGQHITEECVRDKFYSVIQAMVFSANITTGQYISVCLSQVNQKNTGSLHPQHFTSSLLKCLAVLDIKEHLLYLTLPKIVEQLYKGLSHFSLSCFLLLIIGFHKLEKDGSGGGNRFCSEETITKLSKIIFSLIFNGDGMSDWGKSDWGKSDWGKSVITLAVRVSLLYTPTLSYVISMLGAQGRDMKVWYFDIVLKAGLCKKELVVKCFEIVREDLTLSEKKDAEYQINLMS